MNRQIKLLSPTGALLLLVYLFPLLTFAGSWQLTNYMKIPREDHTATRLAGGCVLITGGWDIYLVPTYTAEIYDRRSGLFDWTSGNMNVSRTSHTADLLPTGNVLIAGGWYGHDLNSAELFDPVTQTFTYTGSMRDCRSHHASAILPGGNVIVFGGYGAGGNLDSAEIYDYSSGSWTALSATMNEGRSDLTVVSLGSTILIMGGSYDDDTSCEIYDVASQTFSYTGNLHHGREEGAKAGRLPDGRVILAAGFDADGTYCNYAEVWDPATGLWTISPLRVPHQYDPTVTYFPPTQNILIAGGDSATPLWSEEFDRNINAFVDVARMRIGTYRHTATFLPYLNNGRGGILATGGFKAGGTVSGRAEIYSP